MFQDVKGVLKRIRVDVEWALWMSPYRSYFYKVQISDDGDGKFSLDISEIGEGSRKICFNKFVTIMETRGYTKDDFDSSDLEEGFIYINFNDIFSKDI